MTNLNHLYHEEIGRNPKIIIDTTEIEPGRIETMAMDANGRELDSATSATAGAAARDFRDMIARYGGPLQSAFYGAQLLPGLRYTLVTLSEFGLPVALRMTYHGAKLTTYAQYVDAVQIELTPFKKRREHRMFLYNRSFLLYHGWRALDDDAIYTTRESANGTKAMMAKYPSFDERYITDIMAKWPDYIVAYEHEKPVKSTADAPAHEEKQRDPFRLLPGMTVRFDVEDADGPCVDMEAEDFARMCVFHDGMDVHERLACALRRAAIASVRCIDEPDKGTCNFDSPALYYAACGMSRAEAQGVIESVGLHCHEWRPFKNGRGDGGNIIKAPTYLVISGFTSGQGNRRTKMAKAFCDSLSHDGFEAQMYYQMD